MSSLPSSQTPDNRDPEPKTLMDKTVWFGLNNPLIVTILLAALVVAGFIFAPFDWEDNLIPRYPVAVDAIPDIGENQQVVFTSWPGRSPRDVEDQITYPVTVAMLGLPDVKTVRSFSMFGFSSIYVIFQDGVDFYWARSRILEKLSSLSDAALPDGVKPALGPDATALGQVFWYTLEGRDAQGKAVGGWDPQELRSLQDWFVRPALQSAGGISEVAAIGGHVREYQIDLNPTKLLQYGVTLEEVAAAVRAANTEVGARTIEINRVEYVIRGLGYVRSLKDLAQTVVKVRDHIPIRLADVATLKLGPAERRGVLDKGGAEATGAVAIVRYGYNPLAAIKNLKRKIAEIAPAMPVRAVIDYAGVTPAEVEKFAREHGFAAFVDGQANQTAWQEILKQPTRPDWLNSSKVTIVPFYDRTQLIHETLGTLDKAIVEEILITILVIVFMLSNLRSSLVISSTMPLAVLGSFIAMKIFKVDANIVALSGIAIAIGTIVDMSIIMCENILRRVEEAPPDSKLVNVVYYASSEVASAVLTAILTTVVSFLPVFTMTGAEGKLFKPLAFTKTFALLASVIIAIAVVPVVLMGTLKLRMPRRIVSRLGAALLPAAAGFLVFHYHWRYLAVGLWLGAALLPLWPLLPSYLAGWIRRSANILVFVLTAALLARHWEPLGAEKGFWLNFVMVMIPVLALLGFFSVYQHTYAPFLRLFLRHKIMFLSLPALIVILGGCIWLGVDTLFGRLPESIRKTELYVKARHAMPGLSKEFMPPLDEGSFLYMPTAMPHASIGEALELLQLLDSRLAAIPEVATSVGKIGRADTAIAPAPISMVETVVIYQPQYLTGTDGTPARFRCETEQTDLFRDLDGRPVTFNGKPYYVRGKFSRDRNGRPIPDPDGQPFRLWRPALDPQLNPGRKAWPGIRNPDDIWKLLVQAGSIPGLTSAPKLQPIAARIVMLQSGMRAPMGIKVKGPDQATIEKAGIELEAMLRNVPGVEASSVFAERIVGKPYLEIVPRRDAIARYGLRIADLQNVIAVAIGGIKLTETVEGRERYPVRVRYQRELRDSLEALPRILVATSTGAQIPLGQLADIRYVRGPEMIKSEDTFLTGYVLFDKKDGFTDVNVVEDAKQYLETQIKAGRLKLPSGVTYAFAGSYENQVRAQKTFALILPLALLMIFLLIYLQFRSAPVSLLLFSAIAVAWSGGFILLWLYDCEWFLNFNIWGVNFRELMNIRPLSLSTAVWVGFLALFGIATDDGVVITTYLNQSFAGSQPGSIAEVRDLTVRGAHRRIRPCLMTSATTILALLPVLTATGRGADIMIPMAIPSFGGMMVVLISSYVVPVLYCQLQEFKFKYAAKAKA